MTLRLTGLIAVWGVVALAAASAPKPETITYERIRATITPGKPGAPTEVIEVRRMGERCRLLVERSSPDLKSITRESVVLQAPDCEQVWKQARERELDHWKARETSGKTSDFGRRRLTSQWRAPANGKSVSNDLSWANPLQNEAEITPVLDLLGQLAHRRATKVPLSYFPGK